MPLIYSFPPIADHRASVLILGSMPGEESLRAKEYYAHPHNVFWRIMDDLLGTGEKLSYTERARQLRTAGIALWDVLAACKRTGSLDAAIDTRSIIANDFQSFFASHRHIRHVFFNGATAERCFRMHVQPALSTGSLHYQRLPSTSPAHAARNYAQKLAAWTVVRQHAGRAPASAQSRH